ncbi:hypothetical protein [Nitrosomonas sp.]|uniref:hypothetical protein n=1 Tax=Nitrosomonas sp. TaxID=42353 RepID=UPI0028430EA8|nr:hypothetical protein [Nitrosomonas sp.]MDR4513640.1 hypothetical protein [Nitrosomonas sp.]
MIDIDKIISDLPKLGNVQRAKLFQALLRLAQDSASTEPQSHRDLVPIDVPVESHKDSETGILTIRFPYSQGLRGNLSWREMEVTQAAQKSLLLIFYESLKLDESEGRNQSKSSNLQ